MPEDLSFLDDRPAAARRGFTQHDTLEFMGRPLRPFGLGTLDVLQETQNRYFTGGSKNAGVSDIAGFILLHLRDGDDSRRARAAAWSGKIIWREYVNSYLEENPDFLKEFQAFAPKIEQMVSDWMATQTRVPPGGEGAKKKDGPRTQRRGRSAR